MTTVAFSLSQAVYRSDYKQNVQGKMIPTDKTVDLERAYNANKIQSEVSTKLWAPQSSWYSKPKLSRFSFSGEAACHHSEMKVGKYPNLSYKNTF